MPYTHFQYIAYQIPTVARTAAEQKIYGIPPSNPITAPPALAPPLQGNVAGLGDDAQRRIERLIGAMLVAANKLQSSKDNNQTLKIFMVPEFYFRPANEEVSYTYAQYQAIKNVLRETIKGDDRFKHWLVIPGTIMWKWGKEQSSPNRPNPSSTDDAAVDVYFNSAIYISRADETLTSTIDDEHTKVIEKVEASTTDGIPTEPNKKATNEVFYNEEECWPKYQSPAKREKHIFTTGGITFGLEICLEHDWQIRVVKNVVVENRPNKNIKLHLLIAAGMPVMPVSVAANQGGFILRTDGYSREKPSTNCQQIEMYVEGPGEWKDLSSKAKLSGDIPIEATLGIERGHYLYLSNPPNGDENFWNADWRQQQIKIYQRQLLP